MMNKENLPHIITVVSFVVFIVLGLGSASTPAPNQSETQSGTQRRLNSAQAYLNRAQTHIDNERYDLAIEDCTEAIRLSSNLYESAQAYYGRGIAYEEKGEYDLAIKDYTEAIRLNPPNNNNAVAYESRAETYLHKREYDSAIKDFTEAIRLRPSDPSLYNSRAWTYAYHMKSNYNLALADANQAIRLKPNDANYYDTRGWVYIGMGDYNRATDDFNKALQIDRNLQSSKDGLKKIREAQANEVIDWSKF